MMLKDIIKMERKRLNLTQEQLAKKINTTRQNVTNWGNGYSMPSVEMISECSNLFECTTDYLFAAFLEQKERN